MRHATRPRLARLLPLLLRMTALLLRMTAPSAALLGAACQTGPAVLTPDADLEERPVLAEDRLLSDAEIAAVVSVINQGEIELARLALDRAVAPAVHEYAQILIRDHEQAESRLTRAKGEGNFGQSPTPLSLELEERARRTLGALARKRGTAFDRAYLHAQVELHGRSLEVTRVRLIPAAESDALARFLAAYSPVLEHHLALARRALLKEPLASR